MAAASHISNFYLDGEVAYTDGMALEQNPYVPGDEAAEAWQAGWIAASSAVMSVMPHGRSGAFSDLTTRFSSHPF